jgi:hypothetical protein
MPLPVYILCATSLAVDKETNFVSYFNVVEKIEIRKMEPAQHDSSRPVVVKASSLEIMAVWMKEQDDTPDRLFEVEFAALFPNRPEEFILGLVKITFSDPLYRIRVKDLHLAQFWGPGILKIEARIRPAGAEAWTNRQSYPIILEDKTEQPVATGEPTARQ